MISLVSNGEIKAGTFSHFSKPRSLHIPPPAPPPHIFRERNESNNLSFGEPTTMEFVSADPIRGPPNGPQNCPAPDTAMQKKRLENPRAEKRAQNWGRLAAPPVHIFCSHGPVSGSARRTPKWGRPGHGDSKNLAWAITENESGPKTGATRWPQFGVRQAGSKPHNGHAPTKTNTKLYYRGFIRFRVPN